MRIELLVVPDCPHEDAARLLLRQALDDIGLRGRNFTSATVQSLDDATARSFVGSPSFFADGHDLLPPPRPEPALACRLYAGESPLPSLPDLRRALKQAAALAMS